MTIIFVVTLSIPILFPFKFQYTSLFTYSKSSVLTRPHSSRFRPRPKKARPKPRPETARPRPIKTKTKEGKTKNRNSKTKT